LNRITFNYDDEKMFELRAKTKKDRDEWVEALEFLFTIRDKLGNMGNGRSSSVASYFSVDSKVVGDSFNDSPEKKGKASYKYANVGKDEIKGILDEGQTEIDLLGDTMGNQK
jgi:hypothetical protein